jgi:hypothetical protein
MAAYGAGYYGGGNYSFGISLGEVAITPSSAFSVDAFRFTFGAAEISAATTVAIDAQRTAFISFDGLDASAVVANTNVITSLENLLIVSGSSFALNGKRYAIGAFSVNPSSYGQLTARLKWENYGDTAETWTQLPDTSETWTQIA